MYLYNKLVSKNCGGLCHSCWLFRYHVATQKSCAHMTIIAITSPTFLESELKWPQQYGCMRPLNDGREEITHIHYMHLLTYRSPVLIFMDTPSVNMISTWHLVATNCCSYHDCDSFGGIQFCYSVQNFSHDMVRKTQRCLLFSFKTY